MVLLVQNSLLFPGGTGDDDSGVAADPFDFQPDRVNKKKFLVE